MRKNIEESPITNESELSVALQIRGHLIKGLIHQCAISYIASLLLLTLILYSCFDYIEYFVNEYGHIGALAVCSAALLIGILPIHFVVKAFVKKYTPFEEEIERYVSENPAILDNSSGTLSEDELSYFLSLKREDGANLQRMEKRIRCRE